MEYSRHIIFENIEEKSEEIERCLDKIEKDVDKNVEALKKIDDEFKISSNNYKEKKEIYNKAVRDNKSAQNAYIKILNKTREVFENIEIEDINFAKEFLISENKDKKKELNNILTDNGINEKNPFDSDVISNAVDTSFAIYVKEIELFLNGYDKTKRLLGEIEIDDVKSDKHKKFINDTNVKLHFLDAEKEYIVGFLDNERITAIYDKKVHRKLMLEACRNLNSDLVHLNSLYDIILKEAASRGSKRLYKDNYKRNYLAEIEKVAEGAKAETNKLKANAVAVMNLNYWRIEGISRVQDVFEKDMLNIYGRNISEIFPEENKEPEKKEKKNSLKLKSSKETLKAAIIKLEETETEKDLDEILNNEADNNEIDYENLEELEILENANEIKANEEGETSERLNEIQKNTELNVSDENESVKQTEEEGETYEKTDLDSDEDNESISLFEKISMLDDVNSDLPNSDEDDNNEEDEEESIIDFYFKSSDKAEKKRKARDAKMLEKETKGSILKKLIGVNNRGKREA